MASRFSRWSSRLACCGLTIMIVLQQRRYFLAHGLAAVPRRIAVIGGGASGIFASIAAATTNNGSSAISQPPPQVIVLEATSKTLSKVKISGGGRCNVLHDTSKPVKTILQGYPRGQRELNGPFSPKGFGPTQAQAWFQAHGVQLKTEADGRMFPVTDSSQTVMDALLQAAQQAKVQLQLRSKVQDIILVKPETTTAKNNEEDLSSSPLWHVTWTEKQGSSATKDSITEPFDSVILATGSAPLGYQLAAKLGHEIIPTVPSLFTLNTKDELVAPNGLFVDLAGLSVQQARVTLKLPGQKKKNASLQQEGPLLITHYGLSGPAALRLSAFGARAWHDLGYQAPVTIHWAPHCGSTDAIFDELWKMTSLRPKKTIASSCPLPGLDEEGSAIPRRLWASQCRAAGVVTDQVWGEVSKKIVRKLAMQVAECVVNVTGKGQFKEEFGTFVTTRDV